MPLPVEEKEKLEHFFASASTQTKQYFQIQWQGSTVQSYQIDQWLISVEKIST